MLTQQTTPMVKHFLHFTSSTPAQNRMRIFASSTLNSSLDSNQLEAGRFGCTTMIESDSTFYYAVRSKGSADEELLNQYIETVSIPLHPNMHKTVVFGAKIGKLNQGPVILKLDAGPGIIVSSEAVLAKREALFERGLISS